MSINYEVLFLIRILKYLLLIGCEEIEVTSDLDILNCRTGNYKIQRHVVNQKPVFKHETKEQYLFYMKKGKGFWMVNKFLFINF